MVFASFPLRYGGLGSLNRLTARRQRFHLYRCAGVAARPGRTPQTRTRRSAAQAAAARSNLCTASRACCSRCIERRRSSGFSVAFARMKQHAASARVKADRRGVGEASPACPRRGLQLLALCASGSGSAAYRGGSKACAKNQGGKQRSACTRTTVLTGPCCVPQGETPLGTGHPPSSRPAGERRTCFVTICLLHCPTNGT